MSICNNCGKGGLFFKTDKNGLCSECAKTELKKSVYEDLLRTNKKFAILDKELKTQDNQIERINEAKSRFQEDNDYDALISVLETIFIDEKTTLNINKLQLAELYLKTGQNDKAYSYASKLLLDKQQEASRVRLFMFKVLKTEKKYIDAMLMLMFSHLLKSKWNNTFQSEIFTKDAKLVASKLKWDSSKVDYLAYLIENQVKQKNYDEMLLRDKYKAFLAELKSNS